MTDRGSLDVARNPQEQPETGPEFSARDRRWHWIRITVGAAFAAFVIAVVLAVGVPTGRVSIAVLMVTGLGISRLGFGWRALLQVLLDWLPFTLVLLAYDQTRSLADTVGLPLHQADIARWESDLFGGHNPSVVLQQWWYDPHHVHWWDAAFTLIYTSHFLATPVLAAFLWWRERRAWLAYVSRVIVLSVAGLATYVLFPEAPPWMASRHGIIPEHIARLSARGWIWLHASNLHTTLDKAQRDGSNPVAAMPSLHVAMATLVAIFIGSRLRTRWRWLVALYPVAMGLTLVYTGEHYVIDLLAGVAYALAVHVAISAWSRRRAARRVADLRRGEHEKLPAADEAGARV